MPQIKLQEQKKYEFCYNVTLQPRDINYIGHFGNDAVVSLVRTAETKILHSFGFSEEDLGDCQTGILILDLIVNFKAEAFVFDDLAIETHIGEFKRNGFRIFHCIKKGGTIVALAESGVVTINNISKKNSIVPKAFMTAVSSQFKKTTL